MHKILFICHANVCRSPIAEYVMKYLVNARGIADQFVIESAGVDPDLGCDIWPDSQKVMTANGIPWEHREARQLTYLDYKLWDYIVGMDYSNVQHAIRIFGSDPEGKVRLLLGKDAVQDPYFCGGFDKTYKIIYDGCSKLLDEIVRKKD